MMLACSIYTANLVPINHQSILWPSKVDAYRRTWLLWGWHLHRKTWQCLQRLRRLLQSEQDPAQSATIPRKTGALILILIYCLLLETINLKNIALAKFNLDRFLSNLMFVASQVEAKKWRWTSDCESLQRKDYCYLAGSPFGTCSAASPWQWTFGDINQEHDAFLKVLKNSLQKQNLPCFLKNGIVHTKILQYYNPS